MSKSNQENSVYVTPELLAELDAMAQPVVPQGFFDDISGESVLELPPIDVEDIPEAEIVHEMKSVSELRAAARILSKTERDAYLKDSRRGVKPTLPTGFQKSK